APNTDPQATVLGKEQWAWLEQQLKTPARLRIIVSSIQVAANEHYWEKWGNFPLERDRLFRAVHAAAATGVVFISGDRHHAEIARAEGGVGYPLFDVTSSSLNAPSKFTNEIGRNRVGTIYREANFGQITIDWKQEDPLVRLQVCDEKGAVVLQQRVPLSKLQPPEKLP
ncbi:MAG: alkaline phosphatase D family protein, partial [Planctomycetia bacterium]|nr:alkaline phosphatase D family protein [Planctomycetia bacterium]